MRTVVRRLLAGLRALIAPGRVDRELDEEVRAYVEAAADARIAKGASPDRARREARAEVGSLAALRDHVRGAGWEARVDGLSRDVGYGWRQLRRSPLFTGAAVLTLMLAIGANSAVFAIVNQFVLQPLPFPDSERIVSITVAKDGADIDVIDDPSADLAMAADMRTLEAVAAHDRVGANLIGGAQPERASGSRVSADFFRVTGIQPTFGRSFAPDEMQPGGTRVVILSSALWIRIFGRDPGVIGATITLDEQPHTVVGVMPSDFDYPGASEFWLPRLQRALPGGFYYTDVIARRDPGATLEAVRQELASLRDAHAQQLPKDLDLGETDVRVMTLHERLYGTMRSSLLLLWGIVGSLLLVACANLANLLFARSTVRRRELALRVAIGASRGRVVRQLLVENVLLACLGAVPGLLLAAVGLRLFNALGPDEMTGVVLDTRALGFTLAVTFLTSLLFGVAPAVSGTRVDPQEGLRAQPSVGFRPTRSHPRRTLVVLELAAAVALTIAGALLAKSYVRFQTIDNGFEGDRVLTASVTLPRARYPDEAGRRAFFEKVLERVRAVPSVEAVSVSQVGVGGFTWTMPWPARHTGASTAEQVAVLSDVGHHYFRTFGIRIVAGAECEAGALVPQAVINEQMARRAFPGRSAVGQLLDLGDEGRYSVIGVASDVRNPKTKALPWATVHTCATDIHHNRSGVIAVRARAGVDPMSLSPVIRLAVSQADPSQPVASMLTVSELVRDATTERWFSAGLVAVFAGITFVLAVVGLYSVIAYLVARRTHEIGVRIALGATQADVARLVLAQGGALTIAGLLLGLGAAVPLARLAASMLFEVEVFDLSVFVATTATMVLVSMTAVAVPALRATRVDALVALRTE